jgi:hypothetical protein
MKERSIMSKDIEFCIAALQAVSFIVEAHASSRADLIKEIADGLASRKSGMGKHELCKEVSAAIYRGVLEQEPPK